MIKLLSYNIHGGVGMDGVQSYHRIGQFLRQRDIDIALLQEVDTRPAQRDSQRDIAALCGDHFQWLLPSPTVHSKDGWYGNAILSRFPAHYSKSLDTSQQGFEPRNIQEATLDTPEGKLHVINTHNGLNRIERRQQIGMLGQLLGHHNPGWGHPLLVAGDFNEWQVFSRAFNTLNGLLHAHRSGKTFPTRYPVFRLDRAWSKPGHLVHSIKVLRSRETRIFSDHYPLELELKLAP